MGPTHTASDGSAGAGDGQQDSAGLVRARSTAFQTPSNGRFCMHRSCGHTHRRAPPALFLHHLNWTKRAEQFGRCRDKEDYNRGAPPGCQNGQYHRPPLRRLARFRVSKPTALCQCCPTSSVRINPRGTHRGIRWSSPQQRSCTQHLGGQESAVPTGYWSRHEVPSGHLD